MYLTLQMFSGKCNTHQDQKNQDLILTLTKTKPNHSLVWTFPRCQTGYKNSSGVKWIRRKMWWIHSQSHSLKLSLALIFPICLSKKKWWSCNLVFQDKSRIQRETDSVWIQRFSRLQRLYSRIWDSPCGHAWRPKCHSCNYGFCQHDKHRKKFSRRRNCTSVWQSFKETTCLYSFQSITKTSSQTYISSDRSEGQPGWKGSTSTGWTAWCIQIPLS